MVVEAEVCEQKGDLLGAIASRIDCIEFGNIIKKDSPYSNFLAGDSIQSLGQHRMQFLTGHISKSYAMFALKRMVKIDGESHPFSETIEETKRTGQAEIQQVIRSIHGLNEAVDFFRVDTDSSESATKRGLSYFFADKRKILDEYTAYMDRQIVNAKLPYVSHPPAKAAPNDPLSQMFILDGRHGRFRSVNIDATNRLLMVGLALKIHKDEHGKYPTTLTELDPGVIASIPDDPFGVSGALKYRLEKDKYVLYSVGPDGKDDGGAAIDDKRQISPTNPKSTARYVPKEDSMGDILLGANVQ